METLQPILDLLKPYQAQITTVLAWVGGLRICVKFIGTWLQGLITRIVARVATTPETDDDATLLAVLGSKGYRLFAFLVDLLTSVKLPSIQSYTEVKNKPIVPTV